MSTPEEATTRAQAIASQVVNLKDAEVLVLRLPDDMSTADKAFDEFRKELRRLLPPGAGVTRAIVLRQDMKLESFSSEELAAVGLSTRGAPPGKAPEDLFESGPLRAAAQAGWDSAMGNEEKIESSVHIANEGLRVIVQAKLAQGPEPEIPIEIEHIPTSLHKARGNGGPF